MSNDPTALGKDVHVPTSNRLQQEPWSRVLAFASSQEWWNVPLPPEFLNMFAILAYGMEWGEKRLYKHV
jgi:hypothetical protein